MASHCITPCPPGLQQSWQLPGSDQSDLTPRSLHWPSLSCPIQVVQVSGLGGSLLQAAKAPDYTQSELRGRHQKLRRLSWDGKVAFPAGLEYFVAIHCRTGDKCQVFPSENSECSRISSGLQHLAPVIRKCLQMCKNTINRLNILRLDICGRFFLYSVSVTVI